MLAMRCRFEFQTWVLGLLFLFALSAAPLGADLNAGPPRQGLTTPQLEEELTRRAVLYSLRAAFDVLDEKSIPALLLSDKTNLQKFGIIQQDEDQLFNALLSEGNYYIVSLKYLVSVGGANWPTDRSQSSYERDAEVLLAALQDKWIRSVPEAKALLSIVREVDKVNAWTEGSPSPTGTLDHFSAVESEVDAAMASD